jgi:hypothetical protein
MAVLSCCIVVGDAGRGVRYRLYHRDGKNTTNPAAIGPGTGITRGKMHKMGGKLLFNPGNRIIIKCHVDFFDLLQEDI